MIDNPKYEKFLIKDFEHWRVYLHEQQNYLGRVYLWANREKTIDLFDLTKKEMEEYFAVGKLTRDAIKEAFNPDLFNYATLGNITTHLHTHVIPRYKFGRLFAGKSFEDRNWGRNYAPYDKKDFDERVLIEIKLTIRDRLEKQ